MSKVLLVSNSDWLLFNFRLPLAKALRDAGHDVVLVCPLGEHSAALKGHGFRTIDWRLKRGSLNPFEEAAALARLVRIYAEHRPDVVQHFTVKPILYGSLATKIMGRSRVPIVINTFMGLGSLFSSAAFAKTLRRSILPLLRFALHGSDFWTVFLNPRDLSTLVELGIVPVSRAVLIVSDGVDTEAFRPAHGEAVENVTRAPVVLMASRLLWEKGAGVFVEAATMLRQRRVHATFWLAGAPDPANPTSVSIEKLEEWRRGQIVTLLGHRSDMPDLYRQAEIVVLPSYYNEGVPRVLLEAAATGLPLVATDIEGCRMIVKEGVNGFLVPARDASSLADRIETLVADPQLRSRMGQCSRRIASEGFSESENVRQWLELYARLLRDKSTNASGGHVVAASLAGISAGGGRRS